jgi:type IV secretion system protein TrbL
MNDLGIIDRFTDVFTRYIDSGFGLLGSDVSFLSSALLALDITLAGLAWALRSDDEVIVLLARKVLYIGTFAFLIGHFRELSDIVFSSFVRIGLKASGSALPSQEFLRPGIVAAAGFAAARPLLDELGDLTGFPEVFVNLPAIIITLFAWLMVVLSFFIIAVQVFVTIVEFKLTTLAGFILVPFALFGKTAFLAERTLGHVVAAGIKVMVLAIIVGIGSTIFGQLATTLSRPVAVMQAMSLVLAGLSLLGLAVFSPSIAAGLVAGAPQLGAGAAASSVAGAGAAASAVAAAGLGAAGLAGRSGAATLRSAAMLGGAASAAADLGRTRASADGGSAVLHAMRAGAATIREAAGEPGLGLAEAWDRGGLAVEQANWQGSAPGGAASGEGAAKSGRARGAAASVLSQAAQTAVRTLKAGDRPVEGRGPDLTDES